MLPPSSTAVIPAFSFLHPLKRNEARILIAAAAVIIRGDETFGERVQCSCSGWPTGNGKTLSNSQAHLGQAA